MKKKIVVKTLTIIIFLFIIVFIFLMFSERKKENKTEIIDSENSSYNSNIIKKVNYISSDANGNTYIIDAAEGEIDINNSDIIYLTDVTYHNLLFHNLLLYVLLLFSRNNSHHFLIHHGHDRFRLDNRLSKP